MRIFGALIAGQRTDHHVDAAANELGVKIGMAVRRNLGQKLLHHPKAEFLMRHLAPAEFKHDFHFHVLAEKINRVLDFDAEVMRVNTRTELDFFDDRGVLVLFGFLFLLGLLIAELAQVHEAADRGRGSGGDFDQVHTVLARHGQRVVEGDDPKLFAVHSDNADFAGTDFTIDPDKRIRRRMT